MLNALRRENNSPYPARGISERRGAVAHTSRVVQVLGLVPVEVLVLVRVWLTLLKVWLTLLRVCVLTLSSTLPLRRHRSREEAHAIRSTKASMTE